ncbi:glycoside hydrolase family 92 protein [Flammeovirga yaeyamensis]|nr:glycoside hydrolase family 92 protein [Flammeovirga yaeyamensis]
MKTKPMKKLHLLLLMCLGYTAFGQYIDPLEAVDPNIGTVHSRWFFYTPAANPFGMAKPAPSTNGSYGNKWGWEAVGYDGTHTSIEGFVNFHEFQVGGISLMPTNGELITVPGKLEEVEKGYRSNFKKENEIAQPGYYSVVLEDYNIKAELTSTPRVSFHRYSFPKGENHLLFDIGNTQGESGNVVDAAVTMVDDKTIEGYVITHPGYVKYYQPGAYVKMYFVAEIDKTTSSIASFNKEDIHFGCKTALGQGAGLALTFDQNKEYQVEVKIGQSYTSIENARLNLEKEAIDLQFDEAKEKAQSKWREMLGKIAVKGGSKEHQTKFYTGLYHALLGRGLSSDVNGQYPSINGEVGQIEIDETTNQPKYNHYNTDAVWGAFWNLTQLWALAYPEYYNEFVQCQLDIYKDGGWLADGVATNKFVSGVGTNYTGLLIASAYNRGIDQYDHELAYQAVRKNELGWMNRPLGAGKADTKVFVEEGFVPLTQNNEYYSASNAEGSQFSASHTLEYSFSASAAMNMAKSLHHIDDAKLFADYSKGWEKLFNEEIGFITPKTKDHQFVKDFDPKKVWTGFQEGNAWQYTFYVPHDVKGLAKKIGPQEFIERLNGVFETAAITKFGGGETVDAFAGLENVYNHGNQPSLHIAWMYNFTDQPYKTQYWVREICDVFYGTDETHGYGYGQDEDQGQLGAWYVLAGIGLFDVAGGTGENPNLQLSMPQFEEVKISLDKQFYEGEEVVIKIKGDPTKNRYIKSAEWNGESLESVFLPWSEYIKGGVLEMKSSAKPKK